MHLAKGKSRLLEDKLPGLQVQVESSGIERCQIQSQSLKEGHLQLDRPRLVGTAASPEAT